VLSTCGQTCRIGPGFAIRIRDALINFDVLMTEGFGLEVDGRMKAVFPTQEEARKSAENLKAPLLQVKVYDAAAHTRTRVQLPTGKATIPIDE
jgi:hypothetical protein